MRFRVFAFNAILFALLSLSGCGASPYISSANRCPADVNSLANIAAWGDSLTAGNQDGTGTTYPEVLAQLSGVPVYNGGVSGQTSTQIATRMLADTSRYGDFTIIWAGRNNYTYQSQVLADVARMVAAIEPPKHFLVLTVLNADDGYENKGDADYEQLIALNEALLNTYPGDSLDIRSLQVDQYNPSIPQDVIDHSHDMVPSSLRYDVVHLNAAGYRFVARQVFRQIVKQDKRCCAVQLGGDGGPWVKK